MDPGEKTQIKEKIGQIYTPPYVAEFMVSRVLNYLKKSKSSSSIDEIKSLKVLEPCSGDGVFLKELNKHGFSDITAFELDYSLKEDLIAKYPEVHFRFENVLGADLNEKFDIVIGNPPYLGQNYNAELFQDYCKQFDFCKKYFAGNMDLFYYFIHLGIESLKPHGLLCYITTNYWITKSEKTGIKYLKPHILAECIIKEYIDISSLQIFPYATGQHNCIFILQKKKKPNLSEENNYGINIIQIQKKNDSLTHHDYNKDVFQKVLHNESSLDYNTYISALTNNDLKGDKSWNVVFPKSDKERVDQIEWFSVRDGEKKYLKDYFIIRNGLIFISDEIFILERGKQIKIKDGGVYIKIQGKYVKLLKQEIARLKKLYKSSAIKKYGFDFEEFEGYSIFFNKSELRLCEEDDFHDYFAKKYPNLTRYLRQFKSRLKETLRNAKENPKNIFFPRRGDRIRKYGRKRGRLMDLEPEYEKSKKVFFPYISDTNLFGYANSSYYATSDTYFLWSKDAESAIDYRFLVAYLNSCIVQFLFKAKNIKIKRSKTKLENAIPIPNFNLFQSPYKQSLLVVITTLSSYMIKWNSNPSACDSFPLDVDAIKDHLANIPFLTLSELKSAIEKREQRVLQEKLDLLFCDLFEINPDDLSECLSS